MLKQIRCSFMDEDALFILKVEERHPFIWDFNIVRQMSLYCIENLSWPD